MCNIIFDMTISLLPTFTMPNESHYPLTRSYSQAHNSFGSAQLPPHSRPARRTLSGGSELSDEGFIELDVSLHCLFGLKNQSC
jgi:hypothetical protein